MEQEGAREHVGCLPVDPVISWSAAPVPCCRPTAGPRETVFFRPSCLTKLLPIQRGSELKAFDLFEGLDLTASHWDVKGSHLFLGINYLNWLINKRLN